jgi:hypothetical protein
MGTLITWVCVDGVLGVKGVYMANGSDCGALDGGGASGGGNGGMRDRGVMLMINNLDARRKAFDWVG